MSLRHATSTVLKGATYGGISTFISRIFDLLTLIFLTRYILAEGYGIWTLSWATLGIVFKIISIFFLGEAIVAYISMYRVQKEYGSIRRFTFHSLGWNFTLSVVGFCIILLASDYLAQIYNAPKMSLVIKLLGLTYVTGSINGVCSRFLNAYKEFGFLATLNIISSISKFCFISLLLILGRELIGAALGYFMQNLFTACLSVYLVWKLFPKQKSNHNHKFTSELRKAIAYNVPVTISTSISGLSTDFLFLYLGWWISIQSIGLVQAASKVSVVAVTFLIGLVSGPFFPVVTEMYTENRIKDMRNLTLILLKHLLPLATLFSVMAIIFAPEIMTIIYGENFRQGSEYLQWFILLPIALVPSDLAYTLLLSAGKTTTILRIRVLSTIVTFVLMLLVIPNFQALGYSIAIVMLTFTVPLPLLLYYMQKLIGRLQVSSISINNFTISITTSSIFLFLASRFIKLTLITLIPITLMSLIIYFLVACAVGYIRRKELEQLQLMIQRRLGDKLDISRIFNVAYKFARK